MVCSGGPSVADSEDDPMTTQTLVHVANPELAARWRRATEEPAWVRWTLIGVALTFLALFLVLPLAVVLYGAFEQGLQVWWAAINEPDEIGRASCRERV